MLIDLGILTGIYLGKRLWHHYQKTHTLTVKSETMQSEKQLSKTDQQRFDESDKLATREFYFGSVTLGVVVGTLVFPALYWVAMPMLAYASISIFEQAVSAMRRKRKIGHDALLSILVLLAFLSGQLFAMAIAIFFYYLGRRLLGRTQRHIKQELITLFDQKPVWLLRAGVELEIELAEVQVGDIIVLHSGDMIPVDGVVLAGMGTVDQHTLTGEAQTVEKEVGSQVLASSQVISGQLQVRVERIGNETAVAKVKQLLEQTTDYKTELMTQGEQWSDTIALPLISLSFISAPFVGIGGMTAILNSSFGTRLQLTAPLSVLNHINFSSRRGILVKDGRALERLLKVDTVLFDKTGTLSQGSLLLGRIFLRDPDDDSQQLLLLAAAAEQKLFHPIAKSIITAAQQAKLELPLIEDSTYEIGLGVRVNVLQQSIAVGSERFMQQQGIACPTELRQTMQTIHEQGHSLVFLAVDGQIRAILEIVPQLRPEVQKVMTDLRRYGVKKLVMVSGDQQQPTQMLAQQLGMDDCYYEVSPKQKAEIVTQLQAQGSIVCFVGDGINDSIAIKAADVSVSIDGASNIARDLAQIILMDGQLSHLSETFQIAHSLQKNLKTTLRTLYIPAAINLIGTYGLGFTFLVTVLINTGALLIALHQTQYLQLENFDGRSV